MAQSRIASRLSFRPDHRYVMTASAADITTLLQHANVGDAASQKQLFDAVYYELKSLARSKVARETTLTMLSPTSLVHESYERLIGRNLATTENRKVFFGYASKVMRSVIVDYVRERDAEKRGGGESPVTLLTSLAGETADHTRVLAVDEAMQQLKEIDERCHNLVELRYFGGLTMDEAAEALGISVATAARDWEKARLFLAYRLGD
jgi:RNA polymerase sigma factor (TIGR02999 family)